MVSSQKIQALRRFNSTDVCSKPSERSGILYKTRLNLLYLLCLSAFSSFTYAGGPELNFSVSIVKRSCGVTVGEETKNVDLGTNAAKSLKTRGERSVKKQIKFVLSKCPENGKVFITLSGIADPQDSSLLRLNPHPNLAKNLAIEISDENNNRVEINKPSSKYSADRNGNLTIDLYANYYAFGPSTAGIANSTAYFLVQYD